MGSIEVFQKEVESGLRRSSQDRRKVGWHHSRFHQVKRVGIE